MYMTYVNPVLMFPVSLPLDRLFSCYMRCLITNYIIKNIAFWILQLKLLTIKLTPWNGFLLEKLIVTQLVMNPSPLYGTRWFITVLFSQGTTTGPYPEPKNPSKSEALCNIS